MTAYEIMLSESQERMLMVIKPEKEESARKIFEKWEIDFVIVGKITDTGRIVVKKNNIVEVDMPVGPLANSAPEYNRPYKISRTNNVEFKLNVEINAEDALLKILESPNICSKKWISEQYDSTVMNDTVSTSSTDASLVRVHGTNKALAISVDVNPRYCFNDPEMGGRQAVVETWRNITATGARPLAITNCLNFGNPEKENIMGQIVGCLNGMNDACKLLDYPIISGNVSLYNETDGKAILPTPTIGGVGLLDNVENYASIGFKSEDEIIFVIGNTKGHLGASTYLDVIENSRAGNVPVVNIDEEKKNGDFVRNLILNHNVRTCHDISDGGLYVAIAEMVIANNIGAVINLEDDKNILFGEDQARYIIAVNKNNKENILKLAKDNNITIQEIGYTKGNNLVRKNKAIIFEDLIESYENTLPDFYEFG